MRSVIFLIAVIAVEAHAQRIRCKNDDKPLEKHSANVMKIFFSPSLADSTVIRIYDERGAYVDEPLVVPAVKGEPAVYKAADAFYPETRYLATPDSKQCVQGEDRRQRDHSPCEAWFQLNLKQPSPTQPFNIAIDAPPEVGVGVTLQVKSARGDRCTRTVNAKRIENVFASEEVRLALRKPGDRVMPPPACSAQIGRRGGNGKIPVTGYSRSGQSGEAPSLNGVDAAQCRKVTARVLQ